MATEWNLDINRVALLYVAGVILGASSTLAFVSGASIGPALTALGVAFSSAAVVLTCRVKSAPRSDQEPG